MKLQELADKIYPFLENLPNTHNPNCWVAGNKIGIKYISFHSSHFLTKKEAEIYLESLEKGNRNSHFQVVSNFKEKNLITNMETKKMFVIKKFYLKYIPRDIENANFDTFIEEKKVLRKTEKTFFYFDSEEKNVISCNIRKGDFIWFNSKEEARKHLLSFYEKKIEQEKREFEKLISFYEKLKTEDL